MNNELPVRVIDIYNDYSDLIFSCETYKSYFNFDIIFSINFNRVILDFNASSYDSEDLAWCDFQCDLGYIETKQELVDFFEDNYEEIYKNYITEKFVKRNDKFSYNINELLQYLDDKDSVFKDINNWKQNCYAVSGDLHGFFQNIYQNVELVYGKWFGYISDNSVFSKGVCNHGWLEFKYNNKVYVIDPTRWVFENIEPYIYINIKGSEYDRASQHFTAIMRTNKNKNIPTPKDNEKVLDISFGNGIDEYIYTNILDNRYNYHTARTLNYIANTPVEYFGEYTKEIFDILIKEGYNSFIPIDTRELIYGV